MIEHLNAEIVLGAITDVSIAMKWLEATYLYQRIFKNPAHYGMLKNIFILNQSFIFLRGKKLCIIERYLNCTEKWQLKKTLHAIYNFTVIYFTITSLTNSNLIFGN